MNSFQPKIEEQEDGTIKLTIDVEELKKLLDGADGNSYGKEHSTFSDGWAHHTAAPQISLAEEETLKEIYRITITEGGSDDRIRFIHLRMADLIRKRFLIDKVEPLETECFQVWKSNFFPDGYYFIHVKREKAAFEVRENKEKTGGEVAITHDDAIVNLRGPADPEVLANLRPGYMPDGYYRLTVTGYEEGFKKDDVELSVIDRFVNHKAHSGTGQKIESIVDGPRSFDVQRVWVLDPLQADFLRDLIEETWKKSVTEFEGQEEIDPEALEYVRERLVDIRKALAY